MSEENKILNVCVGVFVMALAILGLEYFAFYKLFTPELVANPDQHKFQNLILQVAKVAGIACRVAVLILWPLASIFMDIKDKKGRRPEYPTPTLLVAVLSIVGFLFVWFNFVKIHKQTIGNFLILYPLEVALLIGFSIIIGFRFKTVFADKYGIKNDRLKRENEYSINMPIVNNLIKGWWNIVNPFQGIVIFGSAGSGKTVSAIIPILTQMLRKGFTGIVYDLKFNHIREEALSKRGDITGHVIKIFRKFNITDRKLWIVNFKYLDISHRINVVHPDFMTSLAQARDSATVFMQNLSPESQKSSGGDKFFTISGVSVFQAVLWFLKRNAPHMCTLPHAISLINSSSRKLVNMLIQDPDCADIISSLEQAMQEKAADQIAAVVGTAQVTINSLINPQVYWVLSGNDVIIDLNDPKTPGVLCIGNDQPYKEVYAPVISLICHVAAKKMNQPGRLPSVAAYDEFTTFFLPGIEDFPNQGRQNKCCLLISTQDVSLMVDRYGAEKTRVILASMSNEMYGIINDNNTAKAVCEKYGKEPIKVKRVSTSQGPKGPQQTISYDEKEKARITTDQILSFRKGEFVGRVADSPEPFIKGRIDIGPLKDLNKDDHLKTIESFIDPVLVMQLADENFKKIRKEAANLIDKYN